MMYDELKKSLRICADQGKCNGCKYDEIDIPSCHNPLMREAADAIEELQKQLREEKVDNVNLTGWLAEEHAKHLWIPVTERLPEESGHYLIYVVGGEFKQWSMVTMAYYHKKFYYDDMEDNFDQITHWMPLPQPPEDK